MKYTLNLQIDLPREKVIELFDNTENLKKWQKGLVSFETFEGTPGQAGAKSRLIYKMGNAMLK
jgi:carbon monoxide dehydrogenase subunit G